MMLKVRTCRRPCMVFDPRVKDHDKPALIQHNAPRRNPMKTTSTLLLLFCFAFVNCFAQTPQSDRQQFIRAEAPEVALTHVRISDGTGAAPRQNQTIIIANGKIQSIKPDAEAELPPNALIINLPDYT